MCRRCWESKRKCGCCSSATGGKRIRYRFVSSCRPIASPVSGPMRRRSIIWCRRRRWNPRCARPLLSGTTGFSVWVRASSLPKRSRTARPRSAWSGSGAVWIRGVLGFARRFGRSAPENVAAKARVGRAGENAIANLNHNGRGGVAPRTGDVDLVAELRERFDGFPRNPSLQIQLAGNELVVRERGVEMLRLKARRFNRHLRRHTEIDHVQQSLQERLILVVPAGRRKRKEGLTVFQNHRGAQRYAGAFAGREFICMAG